jgi:HAD superfamily hydrolase (TIGR01549 family)
VTLTLLVDLDDTLLSNEMASFLPAYLQALANHLKDFAPPENMVTALIAGTREMVENKDPNRTLKEVFDATFYPALGLTQDDLRPAIDAFYADVFPSLQAYTQPFPQAITMVSQAFDRGYEIVIATNPLFPTTAILQRLSWAGLPVEEFSFRLIPSYETFHFAKPNPTFYAEILSRLGWPEEAVVMVGDNPYNDIDPARRLGIPAFWVTGGSGILPEGLLSPNRQGEIGGVLPWIDETPAEDLLPDYQRPEALRAILRSTPASLSSLAAEIPEALWSQSPGEGEWSITEILCHLRDVEGEVNIPRLEKLLKEPNPFLPGMDTDPWAEERLYFCQNGPEALQDFVNYRIRMLEILEGLQPEDWERKARHAIFGPTHLREIVSILTGHDRLHIRQVYEALNSLIVPCSG